jgi:putative copper resistance protein D
LIGEARPDAYTIVVGAVLVALYVAGLRRLRKRGDIWPVGRTIAWISGVVVLVLATNSGLATYARVLFSAHMAEHMTLSMIVPILLVLGAPITLALRTLPSPPGDRGPRDWLLAALHSRPAAFLANPVVAATIFVSSFYILYFTGLFPWLMRAHWGHVIMTTHFVLVGFLFFWVLVGIDPGPRRPPHILRIVILFAAMPFHAFFSLALLMSTNVIGASYYTSLERPYATDLIADQHLGGGIGWATGEIPIIVVLITLFLQWRRSDARESRASDRQADRVARGETGGRDAHQEYNDYLKTLAQHGRERPGP